MIEVAGGSVVCVMVAVSELRPSEASRVLVTIVSPEVMTFTSPGGKYMTTCSARGQTDITGDIKIRF